MKLYYAPAACSLSPHIVLREIGIPFELERMNLASHKLASGGSIEDVNLKGYVPVLVLDDGEVLTEGPAIVQYLGDLAPKTGIVPPAGTLARVRQQEHLNFISTELHKNFGPLFKKDAHEAEKESARKRLDRRFADIERILADGRSFLMGETFTAADAYLFTVANWTNFLHMPLDPWPHLKAFVARVAARPAVQAALKAEGVLK